MCGNLSLVKDRHVSRLQPPSKKFNGSWNGKIRAQYQYHSLRLFKTITMVPSRKIYVRCNSVVSEGNISKGIWNFMAKTHFHLKTNVATRIRMMWASLQYQCLRELMKESTYWSSNSELWNLTWLTRFRKS